MDKGLTRAQIDGLVETAGAYVDIVKLGWGTSYVTRNLKQKLEQYRGHGIPVVCGGTFFEVVYGHGKLAQYKPWLQHFGFTHVEISDGTLDIPRDEKLALIADFARDFVVLSEVGSKDSSPRAVRAAPPASTRRRARCAPTSSATSPARSRPPT